MKLTNKKHILQLVALLHAHGIEDVVLCPGSRNAPIVHTLSACGLFRLHPVTDERSAGFYALGMSLSAGRPVAVCVTSGSALCNLYPAAAEAYYQHVPLVLISADRPAAWIGQMDGQTMPQYGALGQMVRRSVNIQEIQNQEDEWYVNRLVNEALLECTHRTGGPVHINVPISEPLYAFDTPVLPEVRRIQRIEMHDADKMQALVPLLQKARTCWLIVGQRSNGPMAVLPDGVLILAEHLANIDARPNVLRITDEMFEGRSLEELEQMRPDLVITLYGHIVNKKLKQYLRARSVSHWHVCPEGEVVDLFHSLTTVVEGQPEVFLEWMARQTACSRNDWIAGQVGTLCIRHAASNPVPALALQVVKCFMEALSRPSVLHLANSSAVRYAEQFPLPPGIQVCCNRGINGIDGCLSTAVGFATAQPDRPNYLLIGDLAFLYDQNGLWHEHIPENLHILLLNSGGGDIFHTLPLPQDEQSSRLICGRHTAEVQHLCRHYGLRYLSVSAEEEIGRQLPLFMEPGGPVLLEIKYYPMGQQR